MERSKKDMYLRIGEPEQDDRVLSGNNPDDVKAFFKEMAEDEANRKQANEQFISNIEGDLREYDRMIVEEIKTKADACRCRKLINSRLNVLLGTLDIGFAPERWERAIEKAKILIRKIDDTIDYLPEKYTHQLTRALTKREQQFLFDRLAKQQFISGDYESFCFAFGGSTTDNFRPIIWLKNKQSLRTLLRQLKSSNLTIAQTMKNVEYFFIDKNGNTLKLPEKDRIHNDNHDEDVMNKIIDGLKQLEKKSATP